jgi:hypothetical protein
MAMNKKEKAEMEALRRDIAVALSLRWTEPVPHDVPAPVKYGTHTIGWTFNVAGMWVRQAWSDTTSHGYAAEYPPPGTPGRSGIQRSIPLYSTKIRALRALRAALEVECAERLLRVDVMIAQEKTPDVPANT